MELVKIVDRRLTTVRCRCTIAAVLNQFIRVCCQPTGAATGRPPGVAFAVPARAGVRS